MLVKSRGGLRVGMGVGGGGFCRHQDGAIQVALAVNGSVVRAVFDSLLSGCCGLAGGQLRVSSCQQSPAAFITGTLPAATWQHFIYIYIYIFWMEQP